MADKLSGESKPYFWTVPDSPEHEDHAEEDESAEASAQVVDAPESEENFDEQQQDTKQNPAPKAAKRTLLGSNLESNTSEGVIKKTRVDESSSARRDRVRLSASPESETDESQLQQEDAHLSPEYVQKLKEKYRQKELVTRLPVYYPGISGCRSVTEYNFDQKISEGAYGVVFRAIEKRTDEVVALKRLKMEKERYGFPITSLREINMLLKCGSHPNIVNVREVVVGSNMDKIYLVMDYIEHDMKLLMELLKKRGKRFTIPQVKTLMVQLLSGVQYMHEKYVIHRDLKMSNLLLSNKGILKIGDFGLAREFGVPLKPMTPVVVTLWYRSPELLLGSKIYSTQVDVWSVGCIFGEFLTLDPIFPGSSEFDQVNLIFDEIGIPTEENWPGVSQLPAIEHGWIKTANVQNKLRKTFFCELTDAAGLDLLSQLLVPYPDHRITVSAALESTWFRNGPRPASPSTFPTWPTRGGAQNNQTERRSGVVASAVKQPKKNSGGFSLKFDLPKFE